MKTKLHLTILLTLICFNIYAQGWEKSYSECPGFGRSVQQTTDSGYVFVGHNSNTIGSIFICRTDINGDTIWTKSFGGTTYSDFDQTNSVVQTDDGGFAITGEAWSFGGAFNAGDIFLLKLDNVGNQEWLKIYQNVNGMDAGQSLSNTNDGGFIIANTGSFSSDSSLDIFLIKTNQNGDTLWTKTYLGKGQLKGLSVKQANDNGFIMSGYIETPLDTTGIYGITAGLIIIKTFFDGSIQWVKIFPDFISGYCPNKNSICQTSDGNYAIAGEVKDTTALNYSKSYLLKIDINGDTLWSKRFILQGRGNYAQSVDATSDGGIIMTGASFDTLSNVNLFLMKTNSYGIIQWVEYLPNALGNEVHQTNDNGFIIVGGKFDSQWNYYLVKTDSLGNTTPLGFQPQHLNIEAKICIFPNPFSTSTTIMTSNNFSNGILTVYNSYGQKVKQIENITGKTFTLTRNNLPSGVYFIRLTQDNKNISTGKLVIID